MSFTPNDNDCIGFTGNPDLYGLGIRVGVYLQWYSTWLSASITPEKCGEAHNANSVFVFAIIVAVLQSAAAGRIRPVEAWMMLQISLGYILTVLSIFGVRLQLLGPRRLERLVGSITGFKMRKTQKRDTKLKRSLSSASSRLSRCMKPFYEKLGLMETTTGKIQLSSLARFKDASMSWNGALWRTVLIGMVLGANLWLLFIGRKLLPSEDACAGTYDYIFMFSKQRLQGKWLIFMKVMGTILTAVFGIIFLAVAAIALRVILFFTEALYVELTVFFVGTIPDQGPVRKFFNAFVGAVNKILKKVAPVLGFSTFGVVGVIIDFLWKPEIFNGSMTQIPRMKDLLKIYVLFASEAEAKPESTPPSREHSLNIPELAEKPGYRYPWTIPVCVLFHVWTLLATVWFILSIELTIMWNQIDGVHELNSTGQLIPFIIGIVGATQAIHSAFLETVKKVYPDWADKDIEFVITDGDPRLFRIAERDRRFGSIAIPPSGSSDTESTSGQAQMQGPSGAWGG